MCVSLVHNSNLNKGIKVLLCCIEFKIEILSKNILCG